MPSDPLNQQAKDILSQMDANDVAEDAAYQATIDELQAQVASVTSERDAANASLAAVTAERDVLAAEKAATIADLIVVRDSLQLQINTLNQRIDAALGT